MDAYLYISTGVFSIIGVIIGAALHYVFSIRSEEREHQRNLRMQAYVYFIGSLMEVYFEGKLTSKLADSIARLAVYGNKDIIKSIAEIKRISAERKRMTSSEFESKYGSEFKNLLVKVIQNMRKDIFPKEEVSDEDISILLFGKD